MKTNSEYDFAYDFANLTSYSFFLTGKAGTGKTTFLKKLKETCNKNLAVVAPTGVAAINAGGVTLHSFFSLPFTPFVPTNEGKNNLLKKQRINTIRKNIFKQLELLIIDEISMVRADLLDAIDTILRHYRHHPNVPFGGVQVIFIGDLYQLSPVIKSEEWSLLSKYYKSPYFFNSQSVKQLKPIYLELKHIFRQSEQTFITLLNEIRNNKLSTFSRELLYGKINRTLTNINQDEYIILTTHNQKANSINSNQMGKIKEPEFSFKAKIEGDFPEKNYPNEPLLTLKKGARVMFIANDKNTPHRYFNGKIGIVEDISEDNIIVHCDETDIEVTPETWENISYTVNENTKQIDEEVLGTYKQYPLRLAWAITVHKSQGLTFDKVILDLEYAFASGQTYVALSRCRSIEGVVLSSAINQRSLAIDEEVMNYSKQQLNDSELFTTLENGKKHYRNELLLQLFDLSQATACLQKLFKLYTKNETAFSRKTHLFLQSLSSALLSCELALNIFRSELQRNTEIEVENIKKQGVFFAEKIYLFEQEILSLPVISTNEDLAQEFVDKLLNYCEELEWHKYVIENFDEKISIENLINSKRTFHKQRKTIEQNSKFYTKLSTHLRDIYNKIKNANNYDEFLFDDYQ